LNTYPYPEDDKVFMRSFGVALELIKEAGVELHIFSRPGRAETPKI
jgi:hypothetical protein